MTAGMWGLCSQTENAATWPRTTHIAAHSWGRTHVESRLAKTRDTLAARPNVRTLEKLEGELSGMLARLRPWDEELDRQLAGLRVALQGLGTTAAVWQATAEVARREGAARTTVTRIAAVRGEVDKARSSSSSVCGSRASTTATRRTASSPSPSRRRSNTRASASPSRSAICTWSA